MHNIRPHSDVFGVDEIVECHTFLCVINGGFLTPDELTVRQGGNILNSSFIQSSSLVKTRYIMNYLKTDVMHKSNFY